MSQNVDTRKAMAHTSPAPSRRAQWLMIGVIGVIALVALFAIFAVGRTSSDVQIIKDWWRTDRGDSSEIGPIQLGVAGVPADFQVKSDDLPQLPFVELQKLCEPGQGGGPAFAPLSPDSRCVPATFAGQSGLFVFEANRVRYFFPVYKRN